MRVNRLVFAFTVLAATSLSGCGTMLNGGSQTVDVIVRGSPSAFCDITTSTTRNSGTFPNKVTVERSSEPLQMECRGEQNLYKKFEIRPSLTAAGTAGNVPTGIIPGLGYDVASGGLWAYPDPLVIDFRVIPDGKEPAWPEDKTIAKIEKPQPVHMQPVLDDAMNPAGNKTEVVDAVRLAVSEGKPTPVAPVSKAARMNPVLSPEDEMGADPAAVKAKEAAKAKAKAEARRKAAAKTDAKAKAEKDARAKAAAEAKAKTEAKKAAEEPAEKLPETAAEEPVTTAPEVTAPKETEAKPEAEAAKPETETKLETTKPAENKTEAAKPETVAPKTDTPASPQVHSGTDKNKSASSSGVITNDQIPAAIPVSTSSAKPVAKDAEDVDTDRYLTGDGQ